MKKNYEQPLCEVLRLDSEDVLTNSDPFIKNEKSSGETPGDIAGSN